MGLLFYDRILIDQLLKDSAFSTELGNFWNGRDIKLDKSYAAFPEASTPINNYRGALFSADGALLFQKTPQLLTSGTKTLSFLVSSINPVSASSLTVFYEVLKENVVLFSYTKNVTNFVSDFNMKFVPMRIPSLPGATHGRVSFLFNGVDTIKLSNPKFSSGQGPSQWCPFDGENSVNVPSAFSIPVSRTKDPLDLSVDKTFPGVNQRQPAGTPSVSIGGVSRSVQPGDVTAGVNFDGLFKEFDEFYDKERDALEKQRDSNVNKENGKFYPVDSPLDSLKFDRKKLKEHLDQIEGTSTRSRSFVSWAKAKLAGYRRAYEMRMHSRLDYYAFAFIDNWMAYHSLPEERELIHRGAGDG